MYAESPADNPRCLIYKPEDARPWSHPQDAEVFIFARYNWWNDILPVASVDPTSRSITLAARASYAIRPNDRYYVQGPLEELDAPGEWHLDRRDGTLYFYPPAPRRESAAGPPPGRTDIRIQGFTLECAEESAILLTNATRCLVAGSTIRNVTGHSSNALAAVAVDGGRHNGVVGNDIHDVGSHAIRLEGGDRGMQSKRLCKASRAGPGYFVSPTKC